MNQKALIHGEFADDKCVVLIPGRRQGDRPPSVLIQRRPRDRAIGPLAPGDRRETYADARPRLGQTMALEFVSRHNFKEQE